MKTRGATVYPTQTVQIKREICRIGQRIWQRGYVSANDGNISVRIAPDRWLCTPTGVSKGFMCPEMICTVNENAEQERGKYKLTSEIRVHIAIALKLPVEICGAIVHTHAPHATVFALAGQAPPMGFLPEVEALIGPIGLVPYETPGSWALAHRAAAAVGPGMNAVLLQNHGLITWGPTLEQAYFHTEIVDNYCRMMILSQQLGGAKRLPKNKLKELRAMRYV